MKKLTKPIIIVLMIGILLTSTFTDIFGAEGDDPVGCMSKSMTYRVIIEE